MTANEVKQYLREQQLEEIISSAVNDAVSKRSQTPLQDIAKYLSTMSDETKLGATPAVTDSVKPITTPIPELMYFDGPGRANLARLALVAGGVEFVDTRIPFPDFADLKADTESVPAQLFGSLPCLKHGDYLVGQSVAIACYAAELGLWSDGRLGSSATAVCNKSTEVMVAVTNEDLRSEMYKCLFGNDASKTEAKASLPEKAGKFLAALERMLERKDTDGPFFFSGPESGPSLADLAVYDNVHSPFPGLLALGVDLSAYPKVTACAAAVSEDPKIKSFAASGFKL